MTLVSERLNTSRNAYAVFMFKLSLALSQQKIERRLAIMTWLSDFQRGSGSLALSAFTEDMIFI
jgi:hypothetical protein